MFFIQFLLWVPLLQFSFSVVSENKLKGEYTLNEKPKIDSFLTEWKQGVYQSKYSNYFNDAFGFRPFFVRVFNQKDFVLFDKIHNVDVVQGKNNVFFDSRYISTLLGNDYLGNNEIKKRLKEVEKAKNFLNKQNKQLLLVLAPNKARYYQESIPDSFKIIGKTNYDVLINELKHSDVDYIDFNQWTLNQKNKHEASLISKYGIHWTEYTVDFAMDSIINYCNDKYNYALPEFLREPYEKTNSARFHDNDAIETMNLLVSPSDETYFYCKKTPTKQASKKILVVGDSFYNSLFEQGFSDGIFLNEGFWYYNKQVSGESRLKTPDELFKTLPETDLVMIVQTEWNLYRLGFGLIEEINSFYTGGKIEDFYVRDQIEKIRSNKEWFENVKQQAEVRGIPLDSMLVRSAKYMLKQKQEKNS